MVIYYQKCQIVAVLDDCEFNVCGFWTAGSQNKQFESYGKLRWMLFFTIFLHCIDYLVQLKKKQKQINW